MTQTKEHIYFIGIGGISMSGLAEILASRGHQVSGTDVKETAVTKHLRRTWASTSISDIARKTSPMTSHWWYTPQPFMTITRNFGQLTKKASESWIAPICWGRSWTNIMIP